MRKTTNTSRRKFIVGSAAAGGGLALGLRLPLGVEPAVGAGEMQLDGPSPVGVQGQESGRRPGRGLLIERPRDERDPAFEELLL